MENSSVRHNGSNDVELWCLAYLSHYRLLLFLCHVLFSFLMASCLHKHGLLLKQIVGLQWVIVNELAHYYTEIDGIRWWNLSTVAGLYLKEKGPLIRRGMFYFYYLFI
jgi:hypothetical protein